MSQELELNELLVIRRNKLDELRGLGVDPFGSKYVRTHSAKEILDSLSEIKLKKSWMLNSMKSVLPDVLCKKEAWAKPASHIFKILQAKFKSMCVKMR